MNTNGTHRGIDEALALSLADTVRSLEAKMRAEMQEEVRRAVTSVPRTLEMGKHEYNNTIDTQPIAASLMEHQEQMQSALAKIAELRIDEAKLAGAIIAGLTPIFAGVAEQMAAQAKENAANFAALLKEMAKKRPKRKLKGKDADGEFEIEEV